MCVLDLIMHNSGFRPRAQKGLSIDSTNSFKLASNFTGHIHSANIFANELISTGLQKAAQDSMKYCKLNRKDNTEQN